MIRRYTPTPTTGGNGSSSGGNGSGGNGSGGNGHGGNGSGGGNGHGTGTGPGPGTGGGGDAQARVLRRLVSDVDRLAHHVTTAAGDVARLRGDVDAHSRSLTHLAHALHPPEPRTGDPDPDPRPGPVPVPVPVSPRGVDPAHPPAATEAEEEVVVAEWLTVTDPATAIRWLSELDAWVQQVWSHYHRLPGCWAWHPVAVAELLTCHHTWIEATTTGAGAQPLAAWHDRWRPGTAHRVTRVLAACERTGGAHAGPTGRTYTPDPTVLDELAHWWATTHATPHRPPTPGLTPTDDR